ncbi:MAG TPA: hypothetical protein VJI32_01275 [Candidatus Nanoarchaeia archaeon]|nr:hypothetical protein [Candidatus Nanoarchaeia archaeon]
MKEDIRKELINDLKGAISILETRESKDIEELKTLSDHAIEDIAVQKDLELVSVTVLLYSIYKTVTCIDAKAYDQLLKELQNASMSLEQRNLGKYNAAIKKLYDLIRTCNAQVKEHLNDVMQAARIKKGATLLQRGLSIGQAAGLMGLSNWELQQYAGKTTALDQHTEKIPAQTRMKKALQLFGVA